MKDNAQNQKMIEMSNKRMRDSNVFRGKFHDTVDKHNTKLETSYKVAVATKKQKLATGNKTQSHLYIPKGTLIFTII